MTFAHAGGLDELILYFGAPIVLYVLISAFARRRKARRDAGP